MADFSTSYAKLRAKGWVITLATMPASNTCLIIVSGEKSGSGMALMSGDTPDDAMSRLMKKHFAGGIADPGGSGEVKRSDFSADLILTLTDLWAAIDENLEARRAA